MGHELRQEFKPEHWAWVWGDEDYETMVDQFNKRKDKLLPNLPPHIRNWFESPIYQTLIKPSCASIQRLLNTSERLTKVVFWIGVGLLILAVGYPVCQKISGSPSDPIIVAMWALSGTASLLASLFKAISTLKDTATQYIRLQIAVAAGLVNLDALQRIVGHQEKLSEAELKTLAELARALAPLISALDSSADAGK